MVNHEILKFVIKNQGNYFCQCGCNNLIIIKKYHYYYGIPKFIKNHGRKGKNHPLFNKISPFKNHNHTDESKKKNSDAHKGKKSWNKGLTSEIDNRIISGENHPSKRIEFRIKLSKERQGKNNPSYGKPQYHGKRYYYNSPLQGNICFRSSYELAYAKYLDKNKILWYYEIETFELSDEMTYTPDFFLPRYDKFIEVKGYMRKLSQEKINKFKEEYPFNLDILYKSDLIKLGISL